VLFLEEKKKKKIEQGEKNDMRCLLLNDLRFLMFRNIGGERH